MLKVLKTTCKKLWCLSACKISTSSLASFLRLWRKTLQTFCFENFRDVWPSPSKIIQSICRKFSCLSVCKKSTLSPTYFLRYCKDTANLSFWVLWAYLPTHTQCVTMNLWKTFVFICMQKNQLHNSRFSGDIAKISKLILGNLGMTGYTHPNW